MFPFPVTGFLARRAECQEKQKWEGSKTKGQRKYNSLPRRGLTAVTVRTNQQNCRDFKKKSAFHVYLLGLHLEINGWNLTGEGLEGLDLAFGLPAASARLRWPRVSSSSFRVALPHPSVPALAVQILLLPSTRPLPSSARPAKRPLIETPEQAGHCATRPCFRFERPL